jgi:hypothetical protein
MTPCAATWRRQRDGRELTLDEEQRRGGAGRAAAGAHDVDRRLVLPVVQDGLEQVGVATLGDGLEEAAADDLEAVGVGAGDHGWLVE